MHEHYNARFWTFSSENLAPPLIFLVQILRLELELNYNDN